MSDVRAPRDRVVSGGSATDAVVQPPAATEAGDDDRDAVTRLLGREPEADFDVVVRASDGSPLVIRNAPLLRDGTPMPTRWWLVGQDERSAVGSLEAAGGVRAAEAAVDPDELEAAHASYAAERDAAIPAHHAGPRPSGGVGGTRQGVKCLHAHYAWHLAGGDDPVGRWVARRLAEGRRPDPGGGDPGNPRTGSEDQR